MNDMQARDIAYGEHVIHCAASYAAGRWIAMVCITGPGHAGDWTTFLNDVHADVESALRFAHSEGLRAIDGRRPPPLVIEA